MRMLTRLIAEYEEHSGDEIHVIRILRKVEEMPGGRQKVNIDVALN